MLLKSFFALLLVVFCNAVSWAQTHEPSDTDTIPTIKVGWKYIPKVLCLAGSEANLVLVAYGFENCKFVYTYGATNPQNSYVFKQLPNIWEVLSPNAEVTLYLAPEVPCGGD